MDGETDREPFARTELSLEIARLQERVAALDRLMEAKFVTFDVMVQSQAEKVALALTSSEKAISKAEDATEKRFDSVNEFRGQLADQATTFVRVDYMQQALESRDALIAATTDRVRELELSQRDTVGIRSGGQQRIVDQRAAILAIVAVSTLILGIVIFAANLITSH